MKFWQGEESPTGLYQSADGQFYTESELPENSDDFCKERYSNEIKAERNARISDTDDYVKLPDITVARSAGAKRSALEDADRTELETYNRRSETCLKSKVSRLWHGLSFRPLWLTSYSRKLTKTKHERRFQCLKN